MHIPCVQHHVLTYFTGDTPMTQVSIGRLPLLCALQAVLARSVPRRTLLMNSAAVDTCE